MAGEKLRGGLIGCGYFADNHLNGWGEVEGVEIVAVCDRDDTRVKAAAKRFGIEATYTDAEAMLADAELDFVDIVTQAPTHRSLVELAARHGKHVICQKPFAPALNDARAMVIACREAGVRLMVHENFRWQRPMRAVRAALDEIGEPFFGRIVFRNDHDIFTNQPYLATDERFIIYDLGIHLLDLARFFTGEVRQLTCKTQRVNPDITGEDTATILLDLAGGGTCVVEACYYAHLARDLFPQTLVHLESARGSVTLNADYELTVVCDGAARTETVAPVTYAWSSSPGEAIQDGVVGIMAHWVDCLISGADPETSGEDNLKTLELVFGCYRSAESALPYRTEGALGEPAAR